MNTFEELAVEIARVSGDTTEDGLIYSRAELPRTLRSLGTYRNHVWSFFKDLTGEIDLVAGTASYTLPPNLRRLTSAWWTDLGGQPFRVQAVTEFDWYDRVARATDDRPVARRIIGRNILLGPAPSAAFIANTCDKLYLEYEAKPYEAAAEGITTPNFPDDFEEAIIYWAAGKRCVAIEDYNKASMLTALASEILDRLLNEDALRDNGVSYIPDVVDALNDCHYQDDYE